ncbi:CLUMA_CG000913, isoform A [Clunio marinus]|uniref:CLUMA_CG000913, isoform A n=1 Tax=Clunio marinus TaxID=568069 RepID=A0A1J1HGJ6_9DIPT|nr:CLUMA_CG000913, isoform A [Clunio marinus]
MRISLPFMEANEIINCEFEHSNFLLINLSKVNLNVLGFYRPPNSNAANFLVKLDGILECHNNLICCGDSNLNLYSCEPKVDHRALLLMIHNKYTPNLRSTSKHITINTISHENILQSKIFSTAPTDSFNNFFDFIKNTIIENTTLDINFTKTSYVQFHGRKKLEFFTQHSMNIEISHQKIERVESYKYLGLIIDEQLTFENHISFIKSKILPMTYAIRRIRHSIGLNIAYQLYFTNIYSHLIFMNPLWSVATLSLQNSLFVIQKKCLRFIQMKHRLSPSRSLFSERILPLPVLNDYHLLILAFKIKNNLLKNNIEINYVNEIHRYGTRQVGNFHIIKYETRYGKADFYRRGLIKFNEMPNELKRLRSLTLFKKHLREYLFETFESENELA